MLIRRLGNQKEFVTFCLVGKKSRRISTGRISTTNGFFSIFALLIDGVMGKEAQCVLTTLSRIMATKIYEPILHIKGWVNGQIAFAVMRSY